MCIYPKTLFRIAVLVHRLASEKKVKKSKIFSKKLQKKHILINFRPKKTTRKAHFDQLQAKKNYKKSTF